MIEGFPEKEIYALEEVEMIFKTVNFRHKMETDILEEKLKKQDANPSAIRECREKYKSKLRTLKEQCDTYMKKYERVNDKHIQLFKEHT